MKQYEYKFVLPDSKMGLETPKPAHIIELEWNELGKDGWVFLHKDEFKRYIFIRCINDDSERSNLK